MEEIFYCQQLICQQKEISNADAKCKDKYKELINEKIIKYTQKGIEEKWKFSRDTVLKTIKGNCCTSKTSNKYRKGTELWTDE